MSLLSLPHELQYQIFSKLNERDFASAASTCSELNHNLCDSHYPFPRITSKVNKNISEKKYLQNTFTKKFEFDGRHFFRVKNGKLQATSVSKTMDLDNRTKIVVDSQLVFSKEVYVSGHKVIKRNQILVDVNDHGETIIDGNTYDFAAMNGSLIYSTPRGLYRYRFTTGKSENISSNIYLKIAIDEKNGIIYGLKDYDTVDKLDFNHPDADIHDQDSLKFKVKSKIITFATTFFKELKKYIVDNFSWEACAIILGSSLTAGSVCSLFIVSTLFEFVAFTIFLVVITSIVVSIVFVMEALKHAFLSAIDAAIR